MHSNTNTLTHEQYINAVRAIVVARIPEVADREKLMAVKLTYGAHERVRGVTYFNQWTHHGKDECVDFACISAMGQESIVQLAGTTIHELGHVLAGAGHGHDGEWHDACYRLGLRNIKAAGTRYLWANFMPDIRERIVALGVPSDGKPQFLNGLLTRKGTGGAVGRMLPGGLPGCTHGVGSRGGKSRGVGSGSRMLKVVCSDSGYTVRVARSWLDKGSPICPCHTRAMVMA